MADNKSKGRRSGASDPRKVRLAKTCSDYTLVEREGDRTRYIYYNDVGKRVHSKLRIPQGNDKTFRHFRWEDEKWVGSQGHREGGKWVVDQRALDPVTKLYIYNIRDVKTAVGRGDEIWLVDGEKDVLALRDAGVIATCSPHSMGSWRRVDYSLLKQAAKIRVVIDRRAGDDQARKVEQLFNTVPLTFVQARSGNDAADHLANGHGLNDFVSYDVQPKERKVSDSIAPVSGRATPEELVRRAVAQARDDAGRNDACMWLVHQLRDNRINEQAAMEAVAQYQAEVEHDSEPPFTWDEAWVVWRKHWNTDPRDPWEDDLYTKRLKWHRADRTALRAVKAEERGGLEEAPLIEGTEFMSMVIDAANYRIRSIWPSSGRIILSARRKMGKTTMTGNLVRALVDDVRFLDQFDIEQRLSGRVVLIDNEMTEQQLQTWLRDQGVERVDRMSVWPIRSRVRTFSVLDDDLRKRRVEQLKAAEAEVVILDCLAPMLAACNLGEDNEGVSAFLMYWDEIIDQCGASEALIVHHMGHLEERARGASRLRDWPTAEWFILPQIGDDGRENGGRFYRAFGRDVDVPETELRYNEVDRHLTLGQIGKGRAQVTDEERGLKVLFYIVSHPGCKTSDATGGDRHLNYVVIELENRGYITRDSVEGAGRSLFCTATDLGVESIKQGVLL